MNLGILFVLCGLAVLVEADDDDAPVWDGIRITFGVFTGLPTSEREALAKGWVKNSGCSENTYFRGKRYASRAYPSMNILYDIKGQIAGLQTSLKKQDLRATVREPFVEVGDTLYLTVYFEDPEEICSEPEARQNPVGTKLLLQKESDYEETIEIPLKESKVQENKKWVQGKCFPGMGMHYWYKISNDMDCDKIYPLFLLYSKGKLQAFGWAMNGNPPSRIFEHPLPPHFPYYFESSSLPVCLNSVRTLSTLHVLLRNNPRSITCS